MKKLEKETLHHAISTDLTAANKTLLFRQSSCFISFLSQDKKSNKSHTLGIFKADLIFQASQA